MLMLLLMLMLMLLLLLLLLIPAEGGARASSLCHPNSMAVNSRPLSFSWTKA
jgi:hypothetical protein